MGENPFKEKRKYIRFENVDVNFKTKEIGTLKMPKDIVEAVARNMSVEGICIRSNVPLKPGAIIELDILVPFQPKPVHLESEVRWCSPIKTEEGKEMFETGVRLCISKTDETKYLLYICEKMMERIMELEEKLKKKA